LNAVFDANVVVRHGRDARAFARRLIDEMPFIESAAQFDDAEDQEDKDGQEQGEFNHALSAFPKSPSP
jgi:hypothetical protein